MISIILTAIGLAMDAFVVSLSNGMALKKYRLRYSLIFGVYFGFFQFFMTFAGYGAGQSFKTYVDQFGHWISFGLLTVVGIKMIMETRGEKNEDTESANIQAIVSVKNMSLLALATSIDAMAVGVSYALMRTNIVLASVVIGVVAFLFSATGVALGKKLGHYADNAAGRIGGGILIFIGVQILLRSILPL